MNTSGKGWLTEEPALDLIVSLLVSSQILADASPLNQIYNPKQYYRANDSYD